MTDGRRQAPQCDRKVKVLLLAAGLGTRLRPLTDTVPKCLLPIAGRPLLDYWFDRLAEAGLREVLINSHHLSDQVRAYIGRINQTGQFQVSETFEPRLLGSAGTIHANRDFMADADDCLIIYADNLSNVNLRQLLHAHWSNGDPVTMMLFHAPHPEACGIVELDEAGRVIVFEEKPRFPRSDLANAGVYVVTADAYREIADMNAADIGFHILPRFIGRARGWVCCGYHLDIGALESLQKAQHDAPRVFSKGIDRLSRAGRLLNPVQPG